MTESFLWTITMATTTVSRTLVSGFCSTYPWGETDEKTFQNLHYDLSRDPDRDAIQCLEASPFR